MIVYCAEQPDCKRRNMYRLEDDFHKRASCTVMSPIMIEIWNWQERGEVGCSGLRKDELIQN